jgi:hypothetical protein
VSASGQIARIEESSKMRTKPVKSSLQTLASDLGMELQSEASTFEYDHELESDAALFRIAEKLASRSMLNNLRERSSTSE